MDGDLLILEIFGATERFLVMNIYNEKELAADSTTQPHGRRTVERALLPLQLQLRGRPFLLAGDFNCHHSLWNTAIQNPNQEARQLANWLEAQGCYLLNRDQEQTFFRSNLRSKSIIDLAFVAGFDVNTWDQWHRAEDTGSDHICIAFSTFTATAENSYLNPLLELPYAISKADWNLFDETLQRLVASNKINEQLQEIQEQAELLELKSLNVPRALTTAIDHVVDDVTLAI